MIYNKYCNTYLSSFLNTSEYNIRTTLADQSSLQNLKNKWQEGRRKKVSALQVLQQHVMTL